MTTPVVLRLALDQNFPTPLLQALQTYLPDDLHLLSLRQIDPRLSELTDRQLLIALHQLGWHGLITNNYKMLDIPAEVAAVVKTRAFLSPLKGWGTIPSERLVRSCWSCQRCAGACAQGDLTSSGCRSERDCRRTPGCTSQPQPRSCGCRPGSCWPRPGSA